MNFTTFERRSDMMKYKQGSSHCDSFFAWFIIHDYYKILDSLKYDVIKIIQK